MLVQLKLKRRVQLVLFLLASAPVAFGKGASKKIVSRVATGAVRCSSTYLPNNRVHATLPGNFLNGRPGHNKHLISGVNPDRSYSAINECRSVRISSMILDPDNQLRVGGMVLLWAIWSAFNSTGKKTTNVVQQVESVE